MASERRRTEDGSTLVLMPAAFLVLLALAAIAVDAAAVYLGQRRLADLAAGLANDAVAGVDVAAFYDGGTVRLDPDRAGALRDQRLATVTADPAFQDVRCGVDTGAGDHATVTCTGRVRPIFGRSVPGTAAFYEIRARESAAAVAG